MSSRVLAAGAAVFGAAGSPSDLVSGVLEVYKVEDIMIGNLVFFYRFWDYLARDKPCLWYGAWFYIIRMLITLCSRSMYRPTKQIPRG